MTDIKNLEDFEKELIAYLEMDLHHYSTHFKRDKILCLDLSCFPWNESFELSLLTDFEPELNEKYKDNPADWRLYNFASNCAYGSWYAVKDLAKWMAEEYAKDSGIFEKLLISCAKALTNEKVRQTLSKKYNLDENFVLRVKNSDDFESENYCQRFM
jgi:hypothetical protein